MSLIIGNGQVQGGNSAFTIKDVNSNTIFQQGVSSYNGANFGYLIQQNVPGFIAAPVTDPGSWVNLGTGGFKLSTPFNNTAYNNGGCYNTTTTRFTAPITGPYLFIFTAYMYADSYIEPVFCVNGGYGIRRGGNFFTRIRGYGMVANYEQDLQMEETIYCLAGDYVEPYGWAGSGACYYYPWYSSFQGIYVG